MNKKDLNLNNPIMVCYLNIGNLTRQRAQEQIASFMDHVNYLNLSTIIVPVKDNQESKIEIIWKGLEVEKLQESGKNLNYIENKIKTLIDIISEDITDENVKSKLREFSLNSILNG
jgi:hypothetical protein